MNNVLKNYALNKIQAEWESLHAEIRPWGVWITQHALIPETVRDRILFISPIEKAWFLSAKGLERRNVWEFYRLTVIHHRYPGFWSGKKHEIGVATFAQYQNTGDLYLDMIWAGLLGMGMRIKFTDEFAELSAENLWLS